MKEQVLIQPVQITRMKEQRFFQVKLPADTKQIIGIETGVYLDSPLESFFPGYLRQMERAVQNRLMGWLQLQSQSKSGIFYSKEVFAYIDRPPDPLARMTYKVDGLPEDSNTFFDSPLWVSSARQEEDPLQVCDTRTVYGFFKDRIGEAAEENLTYKIMLYIWIETLDKPAL